jgi:hypothetical protein
MAICVNEMVKDYIVDEDCSMMCESTEKRIETSSISLHYILRFVMLLECMRSLRY